MNLVAAIRKEHSKKQSEEIVAWVGSSQERFNELFKILSGKDPLLVQRASWPFSNCVLAHPTLMQPHWKKCLTHLLEDPLHPAVTRNCTRVFAVIEIPTKYEGLMMDKCFQLLESMETEVASKSNALTVLGKLSKKYPDIISEIKLLIEAQWTHQTAAFKSSARKVLKMFAQKTNAL